MGEAIERGTLTATTPAGWLGFDRLTPAQSALLAAVAGDQEAVRVLQWQAAEPADAALYAARDLPEEIAAAAAWARARLKFDSRVRLGIIVPDLGPVRGAIERTFRQVLAPESVVVTAPGAALPFEFALGLPLAEVPLVRAALLLLRWLAAPIQEAECTWLLLSGFVVRETERGKRLETILEVAQWDAGLRDKDLLPQRVELGRFLQLPSGGAPFVKRLQQQLRAAQTQLAKHPPVASSAEWTALTRKLLDDAGWSGGRGADSTTFQAAQSWEGALDQLASLDFLGTRVAYDVFLGTLERLALEIIFSPESLGAPVQVMGALEASGQAFDAVWFLGADDVQWPARGQPHPLLPSWLQKQAGMPHADAAADWRLSANVTERLVSSAGEAVFSFAEMQDGMTMRPSPLVRHLPLKWALPKSATIPSIGPNAVLESFEDDAAIPWPVERIAGGHEVLARQAACPFQAFATKRLGARELEHPSHGLSVQQRGTVLHDVLQRVWSEDAPGAPRLRTRACLINAEAEGRLVPLVEHHTWSALRRFHQGASAAWERAYLNAERERIVALALEWLAYERERVDFEVVACERKIETTVGELKLRLRVDRIDAVSAAGGGRLLLDYKTGTVATSGWDGERPDEPQLPLYAVFGGIDGMIGALFAQVRAGAGSFAGSIDDAAAHLLPDLPRTHALVKKPYSEELRGAWEGVLLALSKSFLRGDAYIAPKRYPQTCERCGLRGLCRVAETEKVFRGSAEDDLESDWDGGMGQETHE